MEELLVMSHLVWLLEGICKGREMREKSIRGGLCLEVKEAIQGSHSHS